MIGEALVSFVFISEKTDSEASLTKIRQLRRWTCKHFHRESKGGSAMDFCVIQKFILSGYTLAVYTNSKTILSSLLQVQQRQQVISFSARPIPVWPKLVLCLRRPSLAHE